MRTRNSSTAVTVTAVSVLAAIIGLGNQADAVPAKPQIMTGTVLDSAGTTLSGASVTAYVEHDVPSGTNLSKLGSTTSDGSGYFSLTGALGKAKHSINPDGTVPVEVDISAPGYAKSVFVNLAPPSATHSTSWMAAPSTATAASAPVSSMRIQTVKVPIQTSVTNARMAAASSSVPSNCIAKNWINEDKYTHRNVPVQHIRTGWRANQTYDWFTTKHTKMGVAVDENITIKGGTYGAGMEYEHGAVHTQKLSAGFTQQKWNGHLWTRWRYRRQVLRCTYRNGLNETHSFNTKKHRWVGWNWSLTADSAKDSRTPKCNSTAHSRYPESVAQGKTQTLKGYFSIWGVKLNAAQTTEDNDQLTLRPKVKNHKYYICGSAKKPGDPGSSSMIWERRI